MEKPELTIGDLVTINFALSEKEDKIRSLIAEYPDKGLGKYLDEIKALQLKVNQILAVTPAGVKQ
jgi:hypothetical protein